MTTITVNERTKAGKALLELAKMLAVTNKGVSIDIVGVKKAIVATEQVLTAKQTKWINGLRKIAVDVKTGNYKGQSVESFLYEL